MRLAVSAPGELLKDCSRRVRLLANERALASQRIPGAGISDWNALDREFSQSGPVRARFPAVAAAGNN